MIKVGLLGEDPNDTESIKNLLSKKLPFVQFVTMLRNVRGGKLDGRLLAKSLGIEYRDKRPDIVVFIRDADAIVAQRSKIEERKSWFKSLLPFVKNKGLLLLNIYELEALILADVHTFNKLYKTNLFIKGNVEFQKDPKGLLRRHTSKLKKKFSESDCPQIFQNLNIETVQKNCPYFNAFYSTFKNAIQSLQLQHLE